MKKNVWIINHYACDTFFDNGGRHYYFAKYLKEFGYNPTIFCSNSIHGKPECYFDTKGLFVIKRQPKIDVDYVFVKARPYIGNGFSRIRNMMDFYKNVIKTCKEYAKQYGKPDVIYASSVHPLALMAGIKLAKHFGVKCISEIRDLWPESLIAYGFLKKKSLIAKYLYHLEKKIYKKSDKIIFTMENGYQYIIDKKWDKEIPFSKVAYINNGVDLDDFNLNKNSFLVNDSDLDNSNIIKAVYTGSIRHVNNLGLLLDAAKMISNPNVKILIWGNGDEVDLIKKRIIDENILNVIYKGSVKKEYVPSIICRADINIMHNQDVPLCKYGLSLNKMFEYAAAGKPVLVDFGTADNPLIKFKAGVRTEDNLPKSVAKGIEIITNMTISEIQLMKQGANLCAAEYDFKTLSNHLIDLIESI